MERHGEAGLAFLVSEPAPLDTLTIRAAGASRRSGSIAWVTARTPNTLVSHTARTSSSDTTLGRVDLEYSSTDTPGRILVFEMAALLTSTSSSLSDSAFHQLGFQAPYNVPIACNWGDLAIELLPTCWT